MSRSVWVLLALGLVEAAYPVGLLLGSGTTLPRHVALFFVAFTAYLCMVHVVLRAIRVAPADSRPGQRASQSTRFLSFRRLASYVLDERHRLMVTGLGVAVLLRLLMLGTFPSLSDDLYRYIWDGKVTTSGINPYAFPPAAPQLEPLRTELWNPINAKDLTTPYPPAAQGLFAATFLVAGESVKAQQFVAVIGDALVIVALVLLLKELGLPRERVLIYALNPLCLMHFAHSAHNDGWLIAPLLFALTMAHARREVAAAASLAAAVLMKFFAGFALPALAGPWRARHFVVFAALIGVGFAPFVRTANPLRGVLFEAGEARFNDSLYFVFDRAISLLTESARGTTNTVVAAILVSLMAGIWWLARRGLPPILGAYALLGTLLLLLPVVEPWYALWVLPFAAVFVATDRREYLSVSGGWLLFTGLVVLTELTYAYSGPAVWPVVRLLEYAPLYAMIAWRALQIVRQRHQQPSPWRCWRWRTTALE